MCNEKATTYLKIDSLQAYLLLELDRPYSILLRRTAAGFLREVYEGLATVINLPFLECSLSFTEIYAGIDLTPVFAQQLESDLATKSREIDNH